MSPLGTATVIQGDARALPLPDGSVDLICTSPPYFALRSYQDGGQHYDGQIGSEDTPQQWLENLWECTAEMMRVLKPEGSIFVNLGDKYAGSNGASGGGASTLSGGAANSRPRGQKNMPLRQGIVATGAPAKSLLGLPWRYAIGCIDQLGLILRAEIIWSKPNGLPESVTDRVHRSHEQWFHLVKQPRYFSAVDEIREPHTEPNGRPTYGRDRPVIPGGNRGAHVGTMPHAAHRDMGQSALGKLPGSVWTIPTEPLTVPPHLGVDHFAAYPTEWPRRIITGWTPPGICLECGQGRRPVIEKPSPLGHVRESSVERVSTPRGRMGSTSTVMLSGSARQKWEDANPATITGYVCACPPGRSGPQAPTRPSLVVDPFGGTGTTALVAKALGRHGIAIDLSKDYCCMAEWRTNDPGELAKAARVPKPPPIIDGQMSLLDGGES